MRAELVEDVGGDLVFESPEWGWPSLPATVALFEPDGTVLQAAANVTIDPVNALLDGPSAVGDLTLQLDDATDVEIGRTFMILHTDKQERVVVRDVDMSADIVTLREPVQYAYAGTGGDRFNAPRMAYTVSAALAATRQRGYEARWLWTIDGVTYTAITLFDVVRQKWPTVILPADAFKKYVSSDLSNDVMQQVGWAGDSFAEVISVATERVRWDLKQRGAFPDLFRSFEAFPPVVAEAVLLKWSERGFTPRSWEGDAEGWYQHQLALYEQALDLAVDVTDSYDADDSGDTSATEAAARPAPSARFYL